MSLVIKINSTLPFENLKGKSLGQLKLMNAGLKTPKGIALTQDFYEELDQSLNITEQVEKLTKTFSNSHSTITDLRNTCLSYQQTFISQNWPLKLTNLLKDLYQDFKSEYGSFCIRSSANLEDGQKISFAGSFDSYLDVSELNQFLSAMKYAYSQVFKFEVIMNCLSQNINPQDLKMGVLIQEFSPCKKYGVTFTSNPNFKTTDKLFVSIGKNGQELMSGADSSESLELNLNESIDDLILNQHRLDMIKLINVYGDELDVEWGIVENQIIYFQLRPMTTLEHTPSKDTRWSRDLAEERYPEPISPLGWSILRDVFETNLKTLKDRFGLIAASPDDVAVTLNNYVYVNDSFFSVEHLRPHLKSISKNIYKMLKALLFFILFLPFVAILWPLRIFPLSPKEFGLMLFYKFFIYKHAEEILQKWDSSLNTHIENYDNLTNVDVSKMNERELLQYKRDLSAIGDAYMEPDLAIYIVKMATQWQIKKLATVIDKKITPDNFLRLLSFGLENNRTLEMAQTLDQLCLKLADHPMLIDIIKSEDEDLFFKHATSDVIDEFFKFEKLNGHLTVNWDFRIPTLQEHRKFTFSLLNSLLNSHHRLDIKNKAEKNYQEYLDYKKKIIDKIPHQWLADFLSDTQMYLREFMRIDEEHHFYCSRVFKSIRSLYLRMGELFVQKGILEDKLDIFFLTSQEIDFIVEKRSHFTRKFLVSNRKKGFFQAFDLHPADEYIDGKPNYYSVNKNENTYQGMGASSGQTIGVVKFVKDFNDCKKIKAGDIIVTAAPNPVFVPLYSVASGIVANTGSILSHGMVAAREYGIPAVVGITNITKILKEGQRIQINGDLGIVTILD